MGKDLTQRLDRIAQRAAARKDTAEVRFAAFRASGGYAWEWTQQGARELYFVASTTKLATTAIVLQHVHEGRYALESAVTALLPEGTMDGIAVLDGHDLSGEVTVEHLLSHSSGIADYFESPGRDGTTLAVELTTGDAASDPHSALDRVRGVELAHAPGDTAKARYSDTNFQLLQLIIEELEGAPYAQVCRERVLDPAGMEASFVFTRSEIGRYDEIAPFLYGRDEMRIPQAMASFGADGSLVSTAGDQIAMIRAFWDGTLVPSALLARATATWRPMFFPLSYGTGVMRFTLPRAMTGLRAIPPMQGHSGASGAVAFWIPDLDAYVVGTVNQFKNRSIAFQVLPKIADALR